MKRVLWILMLSFLLFSLPSCEKDKEVLLSEFVIGEWDSQEVLLGETPIVFKVHINTDGNYVLSLSDGTTAVILPEAWYKVDDGDNTITIRQPDFDSGDGVTPTDEVTFDVLWKAGGNSMTWTPVDAEDDTPVLVWTRVDN
jgi:hypothetical protein